MQNSLYSIAAISVLLWGIGFFIYDLGLLIHILLVVAIIAILLRVIKGKDL